MTGPSDSKPCRRCQAQDAPLTLRQFPSCSDCYIQYVAAKVAKRLAILQNEIRTTPRPGPRRFVAGLSFGHSSRALACLLDAQARAQAAKPAATPFEALVVHVDTDLDRRRGDPAPCPAERLLDRLRERLPLVQLERVPLSDVLQVRTVDWSALPGLGDPSLPPDDRLRAMFGELSSVTARADVMRLLVRHLLIHVASTRSYGALLLGHSTTALAALTLSEVANGRGYSVPSKVGDGLCTLPTYPAPAGSEPGGPDVLRFPVYYPLREIFKNELATYVSLVPSMADAPEGWWPDAGTGPVVSHKDTSIGEVMMRYFESVEGPYSGIVSNVVRTAGKLDRAPSSHLCGLCGDTLDDTGDSRWAGEIGGGGGTGAGEAAGEDNEHRPARLCYGCRRSVSGQ